MNTALDLAFSRASPRLVRGRTPWRSVLIHAAVLLLWCVLMRAALGGGGLLGWSIGVVYVGYDTVLLLFTFRASLALFGRAAAGSSRAAGARPAVAVIVAAHDEAAVLPVTLAALLAQSTPPEQIVIADDGSRDDTPALLLSRYGLAEPVAGEAVDARLGPAGATVLRWLRLPHGGKARALNAALTHTEAEIVLTVDADTLLDAGAIEAFREAFAADPELVAATGVLSPVCGPGLSGRVLEWFQTYEYIRNFLSRYAWMRQDGLLLISGAFAGFRRAAVLEVGGFDPDCLVEDYELIHRLRRHSALHGHAWTTAVLGSAHGRTEAPSSLLAFVRQRRRWFGGFLQTQFWYRDMVGAARFGTVGTRMLPVKAIDTLQPLYGLAALGVLLGSLVAGRWSVLLPASGVILAKILLDLGFHCWSVLAYRRWVGGPAGTRFGLAILAALAEPFSFQILRHASAALGWALFLSGRMRWGRQRRVALGVPGGPA